MPNGWQDFPYNEFIDCLIQINGVKPGCRTKISICSLLGSKNPSFNVFDRELWNQSLFHRWQAVKHKLLWAAKMWSHSTITKWTRLHRVFVTMWIANEEFIVSTAPVFGLKQREPILVHKPEEVIFCCNQILVHVWPQSDWPSRSLSNFTWCYYGSTSESIADCGYVNSAISRLNRCSELTTTTMVHFGQNECSPLSTLVRSALWKPF